MRDNVRGQTEQKIEEQKMVLKNQAKEEGNKLYLYTQFFSRERNGKRKENNGGIY